ncbi:hypothetical protein QBC43DRAFT_213848 [Cladorrhinum sp. PSN259]|nr:hypothetical protein QBC43DRAFT_213848 [Cladorrhinum sp. PSN259]
MEYQPNTRSITSESAPLIEAIDSKSDQELFMVPLKRPSPRTSPSRYRNVKPRTPPRSPAKPSEEHQFAAMAFQSPPPPMLAMSPLMSPDGNSSSAKQIYRPSTGTGTNFTSPQLGGPSSSMIYNSPPMSTRQMPPLVANGSSSRGAMIMSPEPSTTHNSPNPQNSSSSGDDLQPSAANSNSSPRQAASTKASSVYSPPASKIDDIPTTQVVEAPEIPPLSSLRNLSNLKLRPTPTALPAFSPGHLMPPAIDANWDLLPDSPLERMSQMRATRDSAYDRAREMEIRRSEWKHVVYRFPVKGAEHHIIDVDLTESSHARLADIARRSSEGFEWNGETEYAEIYRVLWLAHMAVCGEMRRERVGTRDLGSESVIRRLRAGGVEIV